MKSCVCARRTAPRLPYLRPFSSPRFSAEKTDVSVATGFEGSLLPETAPPGTDRTRAANRLDRRAFLSGQGRPAVVTPIDGCVPPRSSGTGSLCPFPQRLHLHWEMEGPIFSF